MPPTDTRPPLQLPLGWSIVASQPNGTPVFRRRFQVHGRYKAGFSILVTVARTWGGWTYYLQDTSYVQFNGKKYLRALADSPQFTEPEGAMLAVELKLAELT